jgi:hypothetical protein
MTGHYSGSECRVSLRHFYWQGGEIVCIEIVTMFVLHYYYAKQFDPVSGNERSVTQKAGDMGVITSPTVCGQVPRRFIQQEEGSRSSNTCSSRGQ